MLLVGRQVGGSPDHVSLSSSLASLLGGLDVRPLLPVFMVSEFAICSHSESLTGDKMLSSLGGGSLREVISGAKS